MDHGPRHHECRLCQALDTILEQLQVLSQARKYLQTNDRTWFMQTLRTELEALGNLTHCEAHLTGDGAIAQGPGAVTAGQSGIAIGGSVHGNVSLGSSGQRKSQSHLWRPPCQAVQALWAQKPGQDFCIALPLHPKGLDSELCL
jgi:hypothetical protein